MNVVRRYLLPLTALALLVSGTNIRPTLVRAAVPSVTFTIIQASSTVLVGDTITADIKIDTGGQGISAVEVYLPIPVNLQYVSADASTSVFDTNVTTPTVTNNVLHFGRAMLSTGGYNVVGSHEVIHLVLTATGNGSAALNITKSTSQAVAYSDSSNVLQTVNGVAFVVLIPTVVFSVLLPARSSLNQAGASLQVFTSGGSIPVATDNNLTISTGGLISDAVGTFVSPLNNTSLYDVRVTVPGFLSRRINGLSTILTTPYTLTQAQALIPGDFDLNNQITITDLATAIRAFNGGTDNLSVIANLAFNGPLTLNNIVTVIYNFNVYPVGQ